MKRRTTILGVCLVLAALLALIPGNRLESIDGSFYCCGMAGIMGFKERFHESSLKLGNPLFKTISARAPDRLITDCLSCRLQFNQALPFEVAHPIEIIREAYGGRGMMDSING